jgi:hypothetical protein
MWADIMDPASGYPVSTASKGDGYVILIHLTDSCKKRSTELQEPVLTLMFKALMLY